MDNNYKYAELSSQQDAVKKITDAENELKRSTGQDIVLIAYERNSK